MALSRPLRPIVRRRWPSAAFFFTVLASALVAWRVATTQVVRLVPPSGQPMVVERVIDGDTLLLTDGHRVRLLGVNTPETKHPDRGPEPLGPEAFELTQSLVKSGPVTLEYDRERFDNYRRVLAYVFLADGRLLNLELVERGMSPAVVTFPIRSDRRRALLEAERRAQLNQLGLWGLPEYRASQNATR